MSKVANVVGRLKVVEEDMFLILTVNTKEGLYFEHLLKISSFITLVS